MKTLTPGTKIRLALWNHVTCATFNTVRSCAAKYDNDPEGEMKRALERKHETAFATHGGSCISANPAFHERSKTEAAGAVTVYDGEVVAVTGEPELYRVRVVKNNYDSPRNSDPIHFDAIEAFMADSHSQVVHQMDGRDVTRGEAAAAFDLVKDAKHWKNPIDKRVALHPDQRELLEFAVPFFAGSPAEILPTGQRQERWAGGAEIFQVKAAGYFETIGA